MHDREIGGRLLFLQLLRRNLLQRSGDEGLHPGQLPIVEALLCHPGSTQQELAIRLHVSAASIALSTKRLQNAGLIEKREDCKDRRRNRLYATKEGEQLALSRRRCLDEVDQKTFLGLTDEERITFCSLLDRMIANLGESAADGIPGMPCTPCHWKEDRE